MQIHSQRGFATRPGSLQHPRRVAAATGLRLPSLRTAAIAGAVLLTTLPLHQAAAQTAVPSPTAAPLRAQPNAPAAPSGILTIPATPQQQQQRQAAFPGANAAQPAGSPTGRSALPAGALPQNATGAAGSVNPQAAPADPLAVARELTGAEPLMPARGIVHTSYWAAHRDWLLPVIVVALLVLAALGLYLRKRARRPVPVDQTALALGRIEGVATQSDDKHFASTVSDAVRQYLEARFHLRAPEQTTEEFLADVRSSSRLPEQAIGLLARLLELADLAKFARQGLGTQQRERMSQCAKELINLLSAPASTATAASTPASAALGTRAAEHQQGMGKSA